MGWGAEIAAGVAMGAAEVVPEELRQYLSESEHKAAPATRVRRGRHRSHANNCPRKELQSEKVQKTILPHRE